MSGFFTIRNINGNQDYSLPPLPGYGLISDDATYQKACCNLNDRCLDLPCYLQPAQHPHQALHKEIWNPHP